MVLYDTLNPAQLTELAQHTERLGYGALWYVEAFGYETFYLGGFLLNQTETLIIASGIANIYARDATAPKQGKHSLAKFSGGRFLLGLGVSHTPLVEDLRGHRSGKPLASMRAYLDAMEKATAAAPALEEPPPTVLAALGPKMTELAAARTAGALPYNVTPSTRRGREQSLARTNGSASSKRFFSSAIAARRERWRGRRWLFTCPCPIIEITGCALASARLTWRTVAATVF